MVSNLIQKITNLFKKPVSTPTTSAGYSLPLSPSTMPWIFQWQSAIKKDVLTECRKMADEDSRVSVPLGIIASDLTIGFFEARVFQEGEKITEIEKRADEVIKKTIKDCQLRQKALGWALSLTRDGDLWIELEVNNNRKLARTTKLEAITMRVRMDKRGRSIENGGEIDPADCYYQIDPAGNQEIATFAQWQIVHIKWQGIDGEPYGTPQFASTRLLWKQLKESEKDQWIRRKIRAGQKKHHKIGTPDNPGKPADVEEYRRINKDTISKPLSMSSDFFSNGLVSIENLEGDANLNQILDIEYQQNQLLCASRVPKGAIPGFEKGINRDILEDSMQGYLRFIEQANEIIAEGYRQIFDFALLLEGINPDAVSYEIVWGEKRKEDENRKIEREISKYRAGVQSLHTTMQNLGIKDIEGELEKIKAEMEQFPMLPYEVQPTFTIAPNPQGLYGSLGKMETKELSNKNKMNERIIDLLDNMENFQKKIGKVLFGDNGRRNNDKYANISKR